MDGYLSLSLSLVLQLVDRNGGPCVLTHDEEEKSDLGGAGRSAEASQTLVSYGFGSWRLPVIRRLLGAHSLWTPVSVPVRVL